jgi:hypothetical protein
LSVEVVRRPAKPLPEKVAKISGPRSGPKKVRRLIGKAHATRRLSGVAEEMGGGAYLFVVGPEQEEDELMDYERLCDSCRGVYLSGHDSPDGKTVGPCLRISRQFLSAIT